jgi:putative phosphoesterase
MRVAVVSDVHGNLPALEAVLAEIEREDVDAIVCCGDVYELLPFGDECRELLERAGARFVRGNADPDLCWPLTLELAVEGLGRVLFCHATPRNNEDVFTEEIADEDVLWLFGPVDADVVVCGHTHIQVDRTIGRLRIVNPGSVGLPYEGERGAFWAVLGPGVDHRRTLYDAEAAAAAARALDRPDAADLAATLLSPPSRREALDTFTPMFPRAGGA